MADVLVLIGMALIIFLAWTVAWQYGVFVLAIFCILTGLFMAMMKGRNERG